MLKFWRIQKCDDCGHFVDKAQIRKAKTYTFSYRDPVEGYSRSYPTGMSCFFTSYERKTCGCGKTKNFDNLRNPEDMLAWLVANYPELFSRVTREHNYNHAFRGHEDTYSFDMYDFSGSSISPTPKRETVTPLKAGPTYSFPDEYKTSLKVEKEEVDEEE